MWVWTIDKSFYATATALTLYAAWMTGIEVVIGMAGLIVCTDALKRTFAMKRPDGSDNRSFPSGHSAAAFYLAVVYLLCMRQAHPLMALGVAIWAPAVAATRVILKKHYIIDVLAGGAFGMIIGGLVKVMGIGHHTRAIDKQ